jgi:hypothetical protein
MTRAGRGLEREGPEAGKPRKCGIISGAPVPE